MLIKGRRDRANPGNGLDNERTREVCRCGHGAGWHELAFLSWRNGRQTDGPCGHPYGLFADMSQDEFHLSCRCDQFSYAYSVTEDGEPSPIVIEEDGI
jgi:hypothetical protein